MKNKQLSLYQDMKNLAKRIHDLSKTHGGIYISAACCGGEGDPGMVTYGEDYKSVNYWPKEKAHSTKLEGK